MTQPRIPSRARPAHNLFLSLSLSLVRKVFVKDFSANTVRVLSPAWMAEIPKKRKLFRCLRSLDRVPPSSLSQLVDAGSCGARARFQSCVRPAGATTNHAKGVGWSRLSWRSVKVFESTRGKKKKKENSGDFFPTFVGLFTSCTGYTYRTFHVPGTVWDNSPWAW